MGVAGGGRRGGPITETTRHAHFQLSAHSARTLRVGIQDYV